MLSRGRAGPPAGLRPDAGPAGVGRRRLAGRRERGGVARRLRRSRRGLHRSQPSARGGGDRRTGGPALLLLHGGAAPASRAARRCARRALPRPARQGLLLQLRGGGQRERAAPGPEGDRPAGGGVSVTGGWHGRTVATLACCDGPSYEAGALRAGHGAVARGRVRRRRLARRGARRHHGGADRRAGAGDGRRPRLQRRSSCAAARRALHRARHRAALRRGAVRRRAERRLHRGRAVRRRARRAHPREGARRRATRSARWWPAPMLADGVGVGRPRQHLRRRAGGVRRGAGHPRR